MSGNSNRPLPSISPASTFGSAHGSFAIKQEEQSDSEDPNSDSIVQNCKGELMEDMVCGTSYGEVSVKKEDDETGSSQGGGTLKRWGQSEIKCPEASSLSDCFGFIRSCLKVVLDVDSKKRHELVRAMSAKLKYVEAITTGKNLTKAAVAKSEMLSRSSVPKLNKVKSSSKGQQREFDVSDEQGDSNSGTDEEMVRKIQKSSYAMSDQLGLVKKISDSSVQCNICDRVIYNVRACAACASYVSRIRTKCRESGVPLPTCHHRAFRGGASCQSCRLRKYIFLSQKETIPQARRRWKEQRPKKKVPRKGLKKKWQAEKKKCMVCEKTSSWFKSWRCSACFIFHTRLIARHQAGEELPECSHDGYYAGVGCKGCRRQRLQREAAIREPELAAKLPEMLIKNTAHSGSDQSKNVDSDASL